MKIVEINDYSDFLSLEEGWREVLQRCNHTIFSTWEWLSTWWKYFGNDKKLLLLLAEENGKVIGIAPLMYYVDKMFGLRMGKIEFIGTNNADYNDFILAEKREDCIKLFMEYLGTLAEKWTCVDLSDIPENSKSLLTLCKISRTIKPIHKCPCISLPNSPDILMKSLSPNLRYDLRRNLRRLEKDGFRVNFADYSDSQAFSKGMRSFFELHQKRWISKGFSGVYAEEKTRNFALDIAKSFSQKGWLGLYLLELSDKPVSALYGFKYKSKFYSYLSGFDPAYRRYSVGKLLLSHAINECIKEGLTEFDFMCGGEEYKDRWNTLTRWNQQVILTKKGSLASFQNKLYKEYWHQGNRLKYILKIK
jgi:CelD/BcsL family acetyltransferase involved in cellulose biosynthesis